MPVILALVMLRQKIMNSKPRRTHKELHTSRGYTVKPCIKREPVNVINAYNSSYLRDQSRNTASLRPAGAT